MKVLKFVVSVALFLCIFLSPYASSSKSYIGNQIKSNVQINNTQMQKKTRILNTLEKENLILTEIKKLEKNKQEDVKCLALNIYHEARGSSIEDMIASTYVVFNRYNSGNYPLTLKNKNKSMCDIVFDKWQFCWTNNNIISKPKEKESWEYSQKLALELYNNPIHQKLAKDFQLQHYVVTPLLYDKDRPKWINKRKLTIQIGKHSYMSIHENIEHNKDNQEKIKNIISKGYYMIKHIPTKEYLPEIIKVDNKY